MLHAALNESHPLNSSHNDFIQCCHHSSPFPIRFQSLVTSQVPLHPTNLYPRLHLHTFPHTRAQLFAIARLYKPADGSDNDADPDDSRVSASLVAKVASLLDHEHEDELKVLLRATFSGIDDSMVRVLTFALVYGFLPSFPARTTRTRLDA